jgi:hypothetical protein
MRGRTRFGRHILRSVNVVFAQWMTFPIRGEEDPPQIRVPIEDNPHEIECLPLVPIGSPPDRGNRRETRIIMGQANLQAELVLVGE